MKLVTSKIRGVFWESLRCPLHDQVDEPMYYKTHNKIMYDGGCVDIGRLEEQIGYAIDDKLKEQVENEIG